MFFLASSVFFQFVCIPKKLRKNVGFVDFNWILLLYLKGIVYDNTTFDSRSLFQITGSYSYQGISSKLSYKHIFLYSNNKTKRFLPLRMMEHITRIFCNDTMICTYVTKCLSLIFFLNRDSDELTFLLIWLQF